ncbi:MAG: hypothetical protein EBW68_00020 [Actinobacteria bacterium]|nr:hypothetical protein [Flavobacteriia bacterium]NCX04157.1 hypothetical protein [Actinomycetota bacterium]
MAEKKIIELEVKENLGNLKQQLKAAQVEVQNLADKFGATSDQAREAAKKAAELKDRIGDAKALTDAFNPDAKFKGLAQALTGVTGGFAAVQGAMALVGSQSEDVEKTLLKVQAAMALAAGIDQLTEAKEAFVNLGRTAVIAFNQIKAAIGGTGIGLIVVSLGVIYTYWEDISKVIGLSTKESEKYAEQQKVIGEQAKEQREEIAKQSSGFASLISQLKATNVNSEERVKLIKKINDNYGTTIKNLKDETKFQNALNVELASYLEYQKAKYALQKNDELIQKNLAKQDELKAKILKTEKDIASQQKQNSEDIKKAKETSIGGISGLSQTDKASLSASISISKLNKELEKNKQSLADAEKRFENYGIALNKAEKNIDKLTDGGKKYVEQVKKDEPEVTKVVKKEKEEQNYIRRDSASTVISDIVSEGTKRLQAEKAIGDKSREQLKEDLDKQKALRERNLKFIIDSMIQVLSITQDLASMSENKYKEINDKVLANENLTTAQKEKAIIKNNANAKKAFEFNKKLQIASTLISTFATAREAYGSQFKPEADISSPIRGAVAAGIATVGGLIAIKKIASTQFQGTAVPSGGDGGGATVPTMSAPQFNVVGQSGVNQLASLNQQPIQAYVVSGQVTSQQALDRNRLANATLGG